MFYARDLLRCEWFHSSGQFFVAIGSKAALVDLSPLKTNPRIAIVVGMRAEGRIANVGHDLTIIGGGSAAQVEARLTLAMN